MTRKTLALILTFLLIIFASSIIFAEENISDELKSSANQTGNTMQSIGNGVEKAADGVMNVGRDIFGGLNDDNMNNEMNGNNNDSSNSANNSMTAAQTTTDNTNGGSTTGTTDGTANYTATRTSSTLTNSGNSLFNLNSTAWTWIIMAITAAVIVSVIYYYGTQFENTTRVHDRNNNNNE